MQLSQDIVIDDKNMVHIKGMISPMELHVILTVGINVLLSTGAMTQMEEQAMEELDEAEDPLTRH